MPAGRAAVDTGALLALANPRDQYHARALKTARRFRREGWRWVGSGLVLAELHAHVLRWRDAAAARLIVRSLLHDPIYEWQDVTVELLGSAVSGWLDRFADQRFSLTDAVTFELMRRHRIRRAFAFDRDFLTAGYELLP